MSIKLMEQYKLTLVYSLFAVCSVILATLNVEIMIILLLAVLVWIFTKAIIPKLTQFMLKKSISGLDINKKGSEAGDKPIPQCIGYSAAIAFIAVSMIASLLFKFIKLDLQIWHLTMLLTVSATVLLGFTDDMIDLSWRYKLIFPFVIAIPLLSAYQGSTHILVIQPFSYLFGPSIELGGLYLVYITLLGIYATNTINIYAGINGLQVGQTIIAAASMLLYISIQILQGQQIENRMYGIYLLILLLGGCIAVMKLNAYPSQVFVGDTFCYFAGIVLALAAISCQLPVVFHWFTLPQLCNFLYSIPQLFGFVFCPRHRLTKYNPQNDTLTAIQTNMNLINLALRVIGPTNEGVLCSKLLMLQIGASAIPMIYQVV